MVKYSHDLLLSWRDLPCYENVEFEFIIKMELS